MFSRLSLGFLCAALLLGSCGRRARHWDVISPIADQPNVQRVLWQCSRHIPALGEATWQPSMADALAMEKLLPPVMRAARPNVDWLGFPQGWGRHYLGMVRHGRRYLEADYTPPRGSDRGACDGGPHYFGAEYDVVAGKITFIAFNGEA